MGTFVIKQRKDDQYQFNLKAGNGEVILSSEGYTTKASCENGIESVRKNASDEDNYEKKMSANDKYYFNLKAGNGQVIGTSELYEAEAGRDNGIASVQKNAPDASIDDQTA